MADSVVEMVGVPPVALGYGHVAHSCDAPHTPHSLPTQPPEAPLTPGIIEREREKKKKKKKKKRTSKRTVY